MSHYLIQISYTADSWAAQLADPRDRRDVVRPLLERLGGHIEAAYYTFGPYDVVLLADLPDNTHAAALSLTLRSSGAVETLQTTPLLPIEEGVAAMHQAAEMRSVYQPPLPEELAARWAAFEEGP
jgi:uncharacterized protein with GYD domain